MTSNGYSTDKEKELYPPFTPGHNFFPPDHVLLRFLKWRIMGYKHEEDIIHLLDVYEFDQPENFPSMLPSHATKHERFFYTLIPERYFNNGEKMETRVTNVGEWRAAGETEDIEDPDTHEILGRRTALVFFKGTDSTATETSWLIEEFSLNPALADLNMNDPDIKTKVDRFVLCRIIDKEKLADEDVDLHCYEDLNDDADDEEEEEEEEEEDEDQDS